jgi:hypothetical protein
MKPEPAKQTTYTTLEPIKITAPTIRVTGNALKWLTAIADLHPHEVGVFGFVDELENNTYVIRDIFYPKHSEAAGATCEISPEGETLMAEWLMTHNREADLSKAKFWGHSHVDMGVSPSGQDETQSIERMNRNESYLIRGIFNKAGLLSISFYDYQNKRRFDNIKWETDEDEEDKKIRAKILELKAVNLPTTPSYPLSNGFSDELYGEGVDDWNQRRMGFGTPPLPNRGIVKHYGPDTTYTPRENYFAGGKRSKKNKHKHSYAFEFTK